MSKTSGFVPVCSFSRAIPDIIFPNIPHTSWLTAGRAGVNRRPSAASRSHADKGRPQAWARAWASAWSFELIRTPTMCSRRVFFFGRAISHAFRTPDDRARRATEAGFPCNGNMRPSFFEEQHNYCRDRLGEQGAASVPAASASPAEGDQDPAGAMVHLGIGSSLSPRPAPHRPAKPAACRV